MPSYWNLDLACKQQQLLGPIDYRDFRETGPSAQEEQENDDKKNEWSY